MEDVEFIRRVTERERQRGELDNEARTLKTTEMIFTTLMEGFLINIEHNT